MNDKVNTFRGAVIKLLRSSDESSVEDLRAIASRDWTEEKLKYNADIEYSNKKYNVIDPVYLLKMLLNDTTNDVKKDDRIRELIPESRLDDTAILTLAISNYPAVVPDLLTHRAKIDFSHVALACSKNLEKIALALFILGPKIDTEFEGCANIRAIRARMNDIKRMAKFSNSIGNALSRGKIQHSNISAFARTIGITGGKSRRRRLKRKVRKTQRN